MYTAENRATIDHVNKKWVKVITVITYVISVSVVALILGLYYKLAWHPKYEIDNFNAKSDGSLGDELKLGTLIVRETANHSMNITEVQSRLLKILSDTINHDKEIKKFIEFVPAPSLESEDKDNSAATKTKAYIIKLNVKEDRD